MQSLTLEFGLRTSLIAAVIALLLAAMRIKTAALRHTIWSGVVLTMLFLPAWLAWGPKASLPLLPREAVPAAVITSTPTPTTGPLADQRLSPLAREPVSQPEPRGTASVLLAMYLAGAVILLVRLAIGTVRSQRLTREACVVPVTIGVLRPRIILPESARDWPQARLDAVLIHEREHARRRDPLFQWLALLNRALFWFHPLAWWLERRLSALAEESCDAAVLAQGHHPVEYSRLLLDLSRSVEEAGVRVAVPGMAMPGAFLSHRIRRMLNGTPAPEVSRARLACTIAACAAAAAILAAGTLVHAQSKSQPKSGPHFEVASVRAVDPNGGGFKSKDGKAGGPGPSVDHLRFAFADSLYGFILKAYGIQGCGVFFHDPDRCPELSGGPAWVNDDRFQIQATMPAGTPNYTLPQYTSGRAPQLQLMLQSLLADRFQLKLRREKKNLPVYTLTALRGASKIKPAAAGEPNVIFNAGEFAPGKTPVDSNRIKMTVTSTSMQELADALANILGRPILDRTNLKGKFEFTLEYERDAEPPDSPVAMAALGGPAMMKALESQAGLKLEAAKAPVDVLVIDHVERPSEN
ncbi:MAG TPA: M56 family metallopeptidase [Bryobacteraceae bacterium]|jgi:uncharacterized protein (TIGR03435 family)